MNHCNAAHRPHERGVESVRNPFLKIAAASLLVLAPAVAQAAEGYATANVNMRAGPSTQYPAVTVIPAGESVIPAGESVEIHGCLADVPWCDVEFYGGRGWVAGRYVQATYQQRRVYVDPQYYRPLGIPTVVFSVGNYWDRYYRDRDFYRDRDRWRRGPDFSQDRDRNRDWDRDRDRDRDRDGDRDRNRRIESDRDPGRQIEDNRRPPRQADSDRDRDRDRRIESDRGPGRQVEENRRPPRQADSDRNRNRERNRDRNQERVRPPVNETERQPGSDAGKDRIRRDRGSFSCRAGYITCD